MTSQANKIIDFHSHHIPARFEVTAARAAPATQRACWEALARTLTDEDLLLKDIRNGELGARVVSIPAQLIADADGRVPHDTIMAMNDHLATLVARYPGRIYGQASVDTYDGDRGAREAKRAIRELGWAVCSSSVRAAISSSMRRGPVRRSRSHRGSAFPSSCIPSRRSF
jgi:predicted TIM-barrel fold metal-dependent hydrolase